MANQLFELVPRPGNTFSIITHANKALNVKGASNNNGAVVIQYDVNPNAENQRWHLELNSDDGSYCVRSAKTGKYWDIKGNSKEDKAALIQFDKKNGSNDNQRFFFKTPMHRNNTVKIVAAHSGHALDVQTGKSDDGLHIIQWPGHGRKNQQFKLLPQPDGSFVVETFCGKVFDVQGNKKTNGAKILQWTKKNSNNDNQRFYFDYQPASGTYKIRAKCGLYLDVQGNSKDKGAHLILYQGSNGQNQQFKITHC
eukprot:CAMPEP_0201546256 /NCGR_PEP_ID=MMETSP0173_2-20130828/2591_1 /ASSEMBLY_ACC=CAM_ASM_000268 /TAXON_ID=218659 /ORGANISM="Vexillifera sp., Strain DIVA3 564/2" /LENGTH=252 /DNA_ID=CAMNT_0047954865 /DNA_START=141 /DNA_END=899 /DNA_ORIENTATION=-